MDYSGIFLTPTELIKKFNLNGNYSALYSIPISWKLAIWDFGKSFQAVSSKCLESLFKTKRVTRFTYDALRKLVAIQPTKVQQRWDSLLPLTVRDLTANYGTSFRCTCSCTLRGFQYTILHGTIITNASYKVNHLVHAVGGGNWGKVRDCRVGRSMAESYSPRASRASREVSGFCLYVSKTCP